jgi:hypothetical protein
VTPPFPGGTLRGCEPGSSVSTVSGYGLAEQAINVRSPPEAKNFSSILCVQTGSRAHPASCTVGTGGPFPGAKERPGRYADHSPNLVPKSRMSKIYSLPQAPPWRVAGQLYLLPSGSGATELASLVILKK